MKEEKKITVSALCLSLHAIAFSISLPFWQIKYSDQIFPDLFCREAKTQAGEKTKAQQIWKKKRTSAEKQTKTYGGGG